MCRRKKTVQDRQYSSKAYVTLVGVQLILFILGQIHSREEQQNSEGKNNQKSEMTKGEENMLKEKKNVHFIKGGGGRGGESSSSEKNKKRTTLEVKCKTAIREVKK